MRARYEMLRSCVAELRRAGILTPGPPLLNWQQLQDSASSIQSAPRSPGSREQDACGGALAEVRPNKFGEISSKFFHLTFLVMQSNHTLIGYRCCKSEACISRAARMFYNDRLCRIEINISLNCSVIVAFHFLKVYNTALDYRHASSGRNI